MADQNNTANVSVGKGVAGGYFFTAPVGTALPTDYSSGLDKAFANVGFLTDEGISHSTDSSTTTFQDMNGDDIATASSGRTRTLEVQFAEVNPVSLKEVVGQANVEVKDGTITVHHNNADMPHRSIVEELVLRDGRRWRRVIPDAQVTDWDEQTMASGDLVDMPVTYTLFKGEGQDDFMYDFIQAEASTDGTVDNG